MHEPVPAELDLFRMMEERRRPRQVPLWAIATAALFLLAIGGGSGWSLRGVMAVPSEGVQALAREAAASYAVYAPDRVRPVEIRAEDSKTLAAWTTKRIRRSVGIPDLSMAGYRFMGGRVVPTEHGPAALFMYDNDKGSRLVILAHPMVADKSTPMVPHKMDGLNGYSWADGGLGFSLVGAAPADVLHLLADDARRQLQQTV
ncbi:anti-sigma factor family protein [Starkeya nomas]|nr:anti-sigma factor [Starkeya nomas]